MERGKESNSYMKLYHLLTDRILKGKGHSAPEQRQAAFENAELSQPLHTLIDKVAHRAYQVTDSDIATVKQTGVNEDQLFELIICAAAGQASRLYESGLNALTAALKEGGHHAS